MFGLMSNALILILLFPVFIYAQTKDSKTLTETTVVLGSIIEDGFAGESVTSYCSSGVDKYLTKGTRVVVSGVTDCKKSYSDDIVQFYEIIYKNKTYYIERSKLSLAEESYYDEISLMTPEQAEKFRKEAKNTSKVITKVNLRKAQKFFDGCKTKGLALLKWSIYKESEYTEGTGAEFEIYNPTTKTIKYIWITFVGFNPVGDKVIDRRRRTSNITVKAVGPIKPNYSGKYQFKYMWLTDLVQTARITLIKVQYMDKSIKTILDPKIITLDEVVWFL